MEIIAVQLQRFILIYVTLAALLSVAPVFSSAVIPVRYRMLLCFFVSLIFMATVQKYLPAAFPSMPAFFLVVVRQLLIGLIVGFLATIVFTTFQLAGQFFSVQMGFGINEVFDPMSQIQLPVIGQFIAMIAILVFLETGAHRMMLRGIHHVFFVFRDVKEWDVAMSPQVYTLMKSAFVDMFVAAFKIALPMLGVFFLVEVTMGLMTKASPQMNIMMLGFPLKIMVGLLILLTLMRIMNQQIIPKILKAFFTDLGRYLAQ
jgi:flagellar biosynthesis protein FliR